MFDNLSAFTLLMGVNTGTLYLLMLNASYARSSRGVGFLITSIGFLRLLTSYTRSSRGVGLAILVIAVALPRLYVLASGVVG